MCLFFQSSAMEMSLNIPFEFITTYILVLVISPSITSSPLPIPLLLPWSTVRWTEVIICIEARVSMGLHSSALP